MALVVEDGTGITGANTYVSVATLQAYADARKILLPALEPDIEALLLKACDFLELKVWVGDVLLETQGLAFPRLVQDETYQEVSTGLPKQIVQAQILLAIEAKAGPLFAAARQGKYKRTKIDQIYVEYNKAWEVAGDLYFPAVESLISPWRALGGRSFVTVRA